MIKAILLILIAGSILRYNISSLVFPAIIVAFFCYVFGRKKKRKRDEVQERIIQDATLAKVKVPEAKQVQSLLRRLYGIYLNSSQKFPDLAEHYDAIMESLWHELSLAEDSFAWRKTLQRVISEWPVENTNERGDLWSKMSEAREATKQWVDSEREAFRGKA